MNHPPEQLTSAPRDETTFRRVLGRFPTGLVVLTATVDDRNYGLTCQAFTSVSLNPPLVGAFLTEGSGTSWAIDRAQRFAVSVLTEQQVEIARLFAISGADKFKDTDIALTPGGLPVITNAAAWMECSVESRFDAGDHRGLLGKVESMGCSNDEKPLVYWRGGYGVFT